MGYPKDLPSYYRIWRYGGKYWKRCLNKARRRCARRVIAEGERAYRHTGGLMRLESLVNWKWS